MGRIWLLENLKSYPIDVVIFEKRGNSTVTIRDKARYIRGDTNKASKFLLKKKKTETKPISLEYLSQGTMGKNYLFLHSPERNVFNPIKFSPTGKNFEVLDEDLRFWNILQHREAAVKYKEKSMWTELLPIMTVFITALAVGLILYMAIGQLSEVNDGLMAVANRLGEIVNSLPASKAAEAVATEVPF